MQLLVKYIKNKKYLKEFLSGSLYMNSLDYFWNNGFDEQRDLFEGVVCTVPASKLHMIPNEWKQLQATDFRFRAAGYRYCNVLCFEKLDFSLDDNLLLNTNVSNSMSKFGNYIAIISDVNEFIRRVNKKVKELAYKYVCGDVNYHELKKDGMIINSGGAVIFKSVEDGFDIDVMRRRWENTTDRDCFDKTKQYRDQNEWRIALYRGIKDTGAYRLEIGDITDIVTVCQKYDFHEKIQQVISEHGLIEQPKYQGNISRKELKRLFCDLGDNKASLMMTL